MPRQPDSGSRALAEQTVARPPKTAKPGRSPSNRSLERGVEILRAFRPGSALLGNMELAERTGLSRATVSRLTQTLVGAGFLQVEPRSREYRLAPAVLSLAHAMRAGSSILAAAVPLMRAAAQAHRINVGLAAPDGDEMVYLESIRYHPRPSLRSVVSGQRVPMESTSLGRAYLAHAPAERRDALLGHFRATRGSQWPALEHALSRSRGEVAKHGFCAASWQPEVVAVATPLTFMGSDYALNVSVSSGTSMDDLVPHLGTVLMNLKQQIEQELALTLA